ncbi:MAG: putative Outer-rane lipoprotein carrier protein precursor [Pseudomonadota bacterium]
MRAGSVHAFSLRRVGFILCATLAFCAPAAAASADGLEALEHFLRSTRSGRADFTQAVTSPAREGQAPRTKQSSGSFEFQRPNRFRFIYRKPFPQTLVADGQTLWLHDPDLNQVTARRQAQALGTTPAALIAAASDLAALRLEFELSAAPDRDGMQWVQATPRVRDGALRGMRVGFRGGELAALEIQDSLGQLSVLRFGRMEINIALPPETFQFKPPPGADVLRP